MTSRAARPSLIDVVREALGLRPDDEARIRAAAPRLSGEVEGWVEAFYARLIVDPAARALLPDDATVLRLKRSLVAWAHELLTLPFDAGYEGARAEIGRVHVRIGMPIHLMVTAMGALRRDVEASVERALGTDVEAARATREALGKALDLELALMLGQFERRRLEVERDRSRAEDLARLARRFERIAQDAVSAALCHAHLLLLTPDPAARAARADALEAALRSLLAAVARTVPPDDVSAPAEAAPVARLVEAALVTVSLPSRTELTVRIDPPELSLVVRRDSVVRALAEVLQNAANHDPGGQVAVVARALDGGGVIVEISDGGPGWPPHVHGVADVVAGRSGMGLCIVDDVLEAHGGAVELFRASAGGAGVRLRWPTPGLAS